jgi:hypothetical protein
MATWTELAIYLRHDRARYDGETEEDRRDLQRREMRLLKVRLLSRMTRRVVRKLDNSTSVPEMLTCERGISDCRRRRVKNNVRLVQFE